jgi:hypothetical protein
MPSPFPGMDPYLEDPGYWGGFHAKLIASACAAINRELPPGYYADIDEYVWLEGDDTDEREVLGKPDTFVSDDNGSPVPAGTGGAVVLSPPVVVTLPRARKKARKYVKLVGPDGQSVLTVIELLSPTNKGGDRVKYLAKRDEYFGTRTSLVEIDLLRAGSRLPMGKPAPPDADYYLFVCRGGQYPKAGVWPFTVRDAIPTAPVPLKPGEADVPLDLQRCVADVYGESRYATRIKYDKPPEPALRPADASWAADLLKTRPSPTT